MKNKPLIPSRDCTVKFKAIEFADPRRHRKNIVIPSR